MMDWNHRLPGGPLPSELLQWLQHKGFNSFDDVAGFLSPEHHHPKPPTDIPDLMAAVDLILDAVDQQEKILIWGDFDVDGQTSTTMLVETMQILKADYVVHIPDRVADSHGVQTYRLKELIAEHKPTFMIVCDTGSAENEGIAYAKSQGLRVVISDHHEITDPPPPADILVNPLRLPEGHPLRTLSGAGITFLLLQALFLKLERPNESRKFLDLMALGLVADVVELVADTRYWLQIGLGALRKTTRPGLLSICRDAYINPERITAEDIGFRIAPLLNSLGRLATAVQGVELLSTRDTVQAELLASEAKSLNEKRKMLTEQMTQSAIDMVENDPSLLQWDALVLMSPHWNSGIVGIVAARLVEKYGKPTALLVEDEAGNARGSIRSVAGFHVSHALDAIGDMLENYGGHELAGGLSVTAEHAPALRRRLSQAFVDTAIPIEDQAPEIAAELPLERITLDFAYQLQRLGPFGQGNPAPKFLSRNLSIVSVAGLGKKKIHQRFIMQNKDGIRRNVFWWSSADKDQPTGIIDLVHEISVSYFKNNTDVQMTLQSWEQVAAPEAPLHETIAFIDCRQDDPATLLQGFKDQANMMVWAEGYSQAKSPGLPFSELQEAENLFIYTAPPSAELLSKAIEKVAPDNIYVLAQLPPIQDVPTFLKTLQGLMQTIIKKHNGNSNVHKFSERLAVTPVLVESALRYFAATGNFGVDIGKRGKVYIHLEADGKANKPAMQRQQRMIEQQWEEMMAYRRYLQRTDLGENRGVLFSS